MNKQTSTRINTSSSSSVIERDLSTLPLTPINEHYLIASGSDSKPKIELASSHKISLSIARILSQDRDQHVRNAIKSNIDYPHFFRLRPPTSITELLTIMKIEVDNHICASGINIEFHSDLHEDIKDDPSSQIAVVELNGRVAITSGETTPQFIRCQAEKVVFEVWLLPINEDEPIKLALDTYCLCTAIREAIILAASL
jgi:hypothetical protein